MTRRNQEETTTAKIVENEPKVKPEYTHINAGGTVVLSYPGQESGRMGQAVRKFQGCSPTQKEAGIYRASLIPVDDFAILYPKMENVTPPSPLPKQ